MSWFIVVRSCDACGGEFKVCGPFDTQKQAVEYDFDDKMGWCASRGLVEAENPK